MLGDGVYRALRRFVEPRAKLARMMFELAAHLLVAGFKLVGPGRRRRLEQSARRVRAFAQLRGEALAGCGQTVVEGASLHDHRLVHAIGGLGETRHKTVAMAHDRFIQARAARVDALGEAFGARSELARQRLRGLRQAPQNVIAMRQDRFGRARAARVDEAGERFAARSEFARQRIAGLREAPQNVIAMREDRLARARAAGADEAGERFAARSELARQRFRGSRQASQNVIAMRKDRFGRARAAGVDEADERSAARFELAGQRVAGLRQALRHIIAMREDRLGGAQPAVVDAVDDVLAARAEIGGQRLAAYFDAFVNLRDAIEQRIGALVARLGQPRSHFRSEGRQRLAHLPALVGDAPDRLGAGALQRRGHLFGGCVERGDDLAADVGDALVQAIGNAVQIGGDALVSAGYGGAHAPAIGDDGLALIGHFSDQRANAPLVLRIGALQGRHFGAHKILEFRGARQRPFDAVAHRGHFAAYRLRKRHHLVGRQRLGLGQPHRDLSHRARRGAQFLRAARKEGEREQEQRRTDRGQAGQADFRPQPEVASGQRAWILGAVMGRKIDDAQGQPGERGDESEDEGRAARRARLHGLQDLPDRRPVVVGRRGGRRQDRLDFGRFRGRRLRQRLERRGWLQGGGRGRRRRRLMVERGAWQGRRLGRRGRRRSARQRPGSVDERVLVRQVQGVFNRRHCRRERVLSLVLCRHCVRLTLLLSMSTHCLSRRRR